MAKQIKLDHCMQWTLLITLFFSTFAVQANAFNLSFASYPPLKGGRGDVKLVTYLTDYIPLSPFKGGINGKFNQLPAFINSTALNYQIKTVVIDPGHGGHDSGCNGAHSQEKHVALDIAKKIGASIRAQYPQINVIFTRTTDVFIPLHERARIANRNQADLFISVHCNYVGVKKVYGSETYVMGLHRADDNLAVAKRENAAIYLEDNYQKNYDYDPDSPAGHIMLSMFQNAHLEQSISFAEKVEWEFVNAVGRKSRGVKQAGFLVLRETTMPSVLIEAGFLSNSQEEAYLRTQRGQQQMASAVFRAFVNYKNEVETGSQVPVSVYNSSPVAVVKTPVEKVQVAQRQLTTAISTSPASYQQPNVNNSAIIASPTVTHPHQAALPAPSAHYSTENLVAKSGDDFISATIANTLRSSPSTTPSTMIKTNNTAVEFVVQLAASPTQLNMANWQNVGANVEMVQEDGYFKYQVRHFDTFTEAEYVRKYLYSRGFKDCFVSAYQSGKKVDVREARRMKTN